MNPESLEKYKLQVYNPGSPYPSPQTKSFKAFPTVSANPNNTFSNRKQSRNVGSEVSDDAMSPKKKIMKEDDVKALFNELRTENEESMKSFKNDFAKTFAEEQAKANNQTNLHFTSIQSQLASISQAFIQSEKTAIENKTETDARLKALEDKFESLELAKNETESSTLTETTIEDVVKNYVDNLTDPAWKANLTREVFEAEHGIIIHGVRLIGANDEARKGFIKTFLQDDMKAPQDIINKVRIREVTRLGSDNGMSKPPPILVKFGHPTERNLILPLSSNLKEGVDVDKNVPKIYQKKHRDFKRHAWKLKLLYNVKSQVVFDGCKMVVRYKKNDKGVLHSTTGSLIESGSLSPATWRPSLACPPLGTPTNMILLLSTCRSTPSATKLSLLLVSKTMLLMRM